MKLRLIGSKEGSVGENCIEVAPSSDGTVSSIAELFLALRTEKKINEAKKTRRPVKKPKKYPEIPATIKAKAATPVCASEPVLRVVLLPLVLLGLLLLDKAPDTPPVTRFSFLERPDVVVGIPVVFAIVRFSFVTGDLNFMSFAKRFHF